MGWKLRKYSAIMSGELNILDVILLRVGGIFMLYKTKGVCSQVIEFEITEDHKVHNVSFIGGCSGNTQGVARLVEGMDANEAISRLEGIKCGHRPTSCPDQLAIALKNVLA